MIPAGIVERPGASPCDRLPAPSGIVTGKAVPMKTSHRCLVVCLVVLAGCKVGYFHTETTLLPDGSIDRAILQPKVGTPEAVQEPAVWDRAGWTTEKSFTDFQSGIRELRLANASNDYFAAWVKSESPNSLPDHFVKTAVDESFVSHFERRFQRRDLGLLIEFTWEETLTDVVTLEGFRAAREEIIEWLCRIAELTLAGTLDEEHDTSKLLVWLRNEGAAFVIDVTDTVYDFARAEARTLPDDVRSDDLKRRVIELCERHGFGELFDEAGEFQDNRFPKIAAEIIRRTVVRKDGEIIDENVIQGLLEAIGMADKGRKSPVAGSLEKEWKRVVDKHEGGQEAFEKRLKNLVARIQGVHGGVIPVSTETFRFVMDFPGVVVQTNGVLLSDNRVRWQFRSSDAWPSGLTMAGRALLDDSGSIEELARWRQTLNRESLVRVHDLLTNDARLVNALKKCRSEANLIPLLDLANSEDDEKLARQAERLLREFLPVDNE